MSGSKSVFMMPGGTKSDVVVDAAVAVAAASMDWDAMEKAAIEAHTDGSDWEIADERVASAVAEAEAEAVASALEFDMLNAEEGEDAGLLRNSSTTVLDSTGTGGTHVQHHTLRAVAEGVLCILAVSLIWVGAGELSQSLYAEAPAPFLLTYINVSEFALLLPLAFVLERRQEVTPADARGVTTASEIAITATAAVTTTTTATTSGISDWRAAAHAAARVAPLWFLAQCSFNASLIATSVGSATALSATSAAFALMLQVIETRGCGDVARATTVGVLLTTLGAAFVGVGDEREVEMAAAGANTNKTNFSSWRPAGDALALFSALCYAFYSRAVKVALPVDGRVSTLVFFGFIGIFTATALAPVVALTTWTGAEDVRAAFYGPRAGSILAAALFKGLIDNILSDLLWARSIQLTSAMLATVGLSLTIPLAIAADALLRGIVPGSAAAVGAAAIFIGFLFTAAGER